MEHMVQFWKQEKKGGAIARQKMFRERQMQKQVEIDLYQNSLGIFIVPYSYKNHKYHRLNLEFTYHFDYLYDLNLQPKKQIGFQIKTCHSKNSQVFYTNDPQTFQRFKIFLKKRLNQFGFHQKLKAKRKLGKGNFASVYLVENIKTKQLSAAKALQKGALQNAQKGIESIINEIQIMRMLNHQNIMKLEQVYQTLNSYYICVQAFRGGQLFDRIKSNFKLQMHQSQQILKNILKGLEHMHSRGIMHRDLKPQNILFRDNHSLSCAIADFGLATLVDIDTFLFVKCGTPGYVAPQVLRIKDKVNGKYDRVCDIFSLGLIFHLMVTGRSPFNGIQCNQIIKQNTQGVINFDLYDITSLNQKAVDLMKKMLEINPQNRISAKEALNHQFFNQNFEQKKDCEQELSTQTTQTNYQKNKRNFMDNLNNEIEKNLEQKKQNLLTVPTRKQQIITNSPLLTSNNQQRVKKEKEIMKKQAEDISLVMKTPLFTGKLTYEQNSPDLSLSHPSPMMKKLLTSYKEKNSKGKQQKKSVFSKYENPQNEDSDEQVNTKKQKNKQINKLLADIL